MFLIPWPQFCWIQSLKRNSEGRNWYPWGGRRGYQLLEASQNSTWRLSKRLQCSRADKHIKSLQFFFYLIFDFIDVSSDSSQQLLPLHPKSLKDKSRKISFQVPKILFNSPKTKQIIVLLTSIVYSVWRFSKIKAS